MRITEPRIRRLARPEQPCHRVQAGLVRWYLRLGKGVWKHDFADPAIGAELIKVEITPKALSWEEIETKHDEWVAEGLIDPIAPNGGNGGAMAATVADRSTVISSRSSRAFIRSRSRSVPGHGRRGTRSAGALDRRTRLARFIR